MFRYDCHISRYFRIFSTGFGCKITTAVRALQYASFHIIFFAMSMNSANQCQLAVKPVYRALLFAVKEALAKFLSSRALPLALFIDSGTQKTSWNRWIYRIQCHGEWFRWFKKLVNLRLGINTILRQKFDVWLFFGIVKMKLRRWFIDWTWTRNFRRQK